MEFSVNNSFIGNSFSGGANGSCPPQAGLRRVLSFPVVEVESFALYRNGIITAGN